MRPDAYYARCSAEPTLGHPCERVDTKLFRVENAPWPVKSIYGEMMVLAVCPDHVPNPLPEGWTEVSPEDFEAAELVGGVHGE